MEWTKQVPIGIMRHRITIESYSIATNDLQEEVITWTPQTTVWANVSYKTGMESQREEREIVKDKIVFTVRYNDSFLDEKKRISYKNRIYDIESIENLNEMNRFLKFTSTIYR